MHTRKRCTKREPSLVVGIAQISWLMVSLLALTKQKQLAKVVPNAKYVSCKTTFHLRTAILLETSQKGSQMSKKWECKIQLAKMKFYCTSVYVCRWKHVLNENY